MGRPKIVLQGRFGNLLRQERERVGISLRELARYVRIDPASLSKMEKGQRLPPDVQPYVMRIVERLQLPDTTARRLVNIAYQERYGERGVEPWELFKSFHALLADAQMPLEPAPIAAESDAQARFESGAEVADLTAHAQQQEGYTTPFFGYLTPEVAIKLLQLQGLVALHGALEITLRTLDGQRHEFVFRPAKLHPTP